MTREKAIDKVAPMLSHIDKMTAGKKIKWMKGLVHQFYDYFEQEKEDLANQLAKDIYDCKNIEVKRAIGKNIDNFLKDK